MRQNRPMNQQPLLDFLNKHGIPYQLYEHQPVFTIEDEAVVTAIDGKPTSPGPLPKPRYKTLFLKDKNGQFFLVAVMEGKRVDLKELSNILDCGRFSFGKPDKLMALLQLTPGSVTPYGILFDGEKKVALVLDEDGLAHDTISFHPMRNDMTLVTTPQNFLRCMELMEHEAHVLRIPTRE